MLHCGYHIIVSFPFRPFQRPLREIAVLEDTALYFVILILPSPWNEARAVVSNPADFTVSRKHSSGGTQSIGHNCHM